MALPEASNTTTVVAEEPDSPVESKDLVASEDFQKSLADPLLPEEEEELTCGPFRDLHVNMQRAKSMVFAATSPIPFHYVTLRNIKLLAFVLILIFIVYHGIQRSRRSNDSCHWLLTQGRIQGRNIWQPNGCMMHTYTSADARMCMRYIHHWSSPSKMVFIGDSRLRFLYNETVRHITGNPPVFPNGKHQSLDMFEKTLNLTLSFLWVPLVGPEMRAPIEQFVQSAGPLPSLVVLSSGTWTMKLFNASEAAFKEYKQNLTDLAPLLNELAQRTRVVWMIQDPVFERLLTEPRQMITNTEVAKYNWAAEEILRDTKVQIWSSGHLVYWYIGDSQDGLHMANETLRQDLQILLNFQCNRVSKHRDATCCASTEPLISMQIAALSVFAVFGVIAMTLIVRQYGAYMLRCVKRRLRRYSTASYSDGNGHYDKVVTIKDAKLSKKVKTGYDVFSEASVALAKLGLIMGYFVLCDRTDFFMKENKYYSNINFFVPLTYIFLLGMFFSENSDQSALLHRDQTDEWKGWMQFVILVYHMTAGSTQLPIYMHVRVLVSSYLFLNGYAHFMYFWNKGDVSAYRFFQIVFRMNLLVFCLCIVMNREYQFYYFVPLVTFWFIMTYLTMALPPRLTDASAIVNPRHVFYMVVKFVIVFGLITTLYLSQPFFEQIFLTKPWRALFLMDGKAHEWFFRWKLDRYSVLQGMFFAFLVTLARKYGWMNETLSENLFSLRKSVAVTGVGALALIGYLIFAMSCRSKVNCNEVHSYIVIIPVVGFILVRNTFGVVRRRFSTLFAWAGRTSLELFIVQFHVWLAADTYGVLVFIPGYPMLNVVFTSFIYVCVAHEIHVITGVLAELLVPKDWKYLLMAVVGFCLLLTLLAVCYGL